MTTRTRYFISVSLLLLGVGLGTGLVAYYVGFPAGALGRQGGPEELAYVPRDATAIAFANVHEIMTSELRQKLHRNLPMQENGQQELQNQTGINLETDVDRVVACLYPDRDGTNTPGAGMVLALGRFDALTAHARLPEAVSSQLPAITWFSASGNINGGIRGVVRAEARDDEAANNLRDVVRGFLALAKMSSGSRPELQLMMQSLELGGTGKTVSLSFTVPSEVFDLIGAFANGMPKKVPQPPHP